MESKKILIGAAFSGLLLVGCHNKNKDSSSSIMAKKEVKGQCHGINACKGKGECGSKTHDCGGKNACKGQGWIKMTKKDCDAKGGQFKA